MAALHCPCASASSHGAARRVSHRDWSSSTSDSCSSTSSSSRCSSSRCSSSYIVGRIAGDIRQVNGLGLGGNVIASDNHFQTIVRIPRGLHSSGIESGCAFGDALSSSWCRRRPENVSYPRQNSNSVVAFANPIEDLVFFVNDNIDGPIELPPKEIEMDPFAIPEASPAQLVASVLLTGAIVVLLIRSLRRRAARAKEMQFRSSGVSTAKSIQKEAKKSLIDNLKKAPEVPTPPPSAGQTAFGAVVAGVIALSLYKFTTSVEASFVDKAVSRDYSIRNLTITVRTIISGLCYLATFVFAANSIGLTLYSFQLLFGFVPSESSPPSESIETEELTSDKKSGNEVEVEAEDLSEK